MANSKQRASSARAAHVRELARDRKARQRRREASAVALSSSPVASASRRSGTPKKDEVRVASRGRRDPFASFGTYRGRMTNPDRTLLKFGTRDGIGLYTKILHQFANVAGYCRAWVDHLLTNEITIKPAQASKEATADQDRADAAAARAKRAWLQARNRVIVLQQLPMGRFYGFARAEMVGRFDEVVKEWIPDLYNVDQEFWRFDDDGNPYLVTTVNPEGIPVDDARFLHFQWGSAETRYGHGDLSLCYISLWKIQQLEDMALRRIEDNESTAIAHVPTSFGKPERAALEDSLAEEFKKVICVPTTEPKASFDLPKLTLQSSGATARPEYEAIRFHERWVQTMLLGAPQTGDKSLGTGKLEETRSDVWNDKTPLGLSAIDQCLNAGWMETYCRWNLPDLPVELWPRFESDSTSLQEGLTGVAAQRAYEVGVALAAKQITATFAVEIISAVGIPRSRAQAMVDSIIKERGDLVTTPIVSSNAPKPPVVPPTVPDDKEGETEEGATE